MPDEKDKVKDPKKASEKTYKEGIDFDKMRKGDKIKVKIKDKLKLDERYYNYMLSRPWFEVKGVRKVNLKTNEKLPMPFLDIGYVNPGPDKLPYWYPAIRFQLVEEGDIDPNDPFGEEKWEVTTTFENRVTSKEKNALKTIGDNIAKLWIKKNDMKVIAKVVAIKENDDTYKYNIRYSVFKVKSKHEVSSAVKFLEEFKIIGPELVNELEKQLVDAEDGYKRDIASYKRDYDLSLKEIELRLQKHVNQSDKNLKMDRERINASIEMCKKQI